MRRVLFVAVLTAVALSPALAHARGPRGGTVMTPFGPAYNTNSPEWKLSGGNPMVYEQIMEQKMMMMQQQQMIKQQQMMLKYQQQQQKKGKTGATTGGTTGSVNGFGAGNGAFGQPAIAPRKKKKRRTYDPTHPVTSSAIKGQAATPAAKADVVKTSAKP